MRWIIALLLSATALSVVGQVTVLPIAAPVKELYQKSAVVVLAQIDTGRLLPNNCGISYTAKIQEGYKGKSSLGKTISLTSYMNLRLGAHYILFLSKSGHSFDNIVAYTGNLPKATTERITRCGKVWPPFTINMAGYAALLVVRGDEPKESSVLFDSFSIVAPKGVEVTAAGPVAKAWQEAYSNKMNLSEFTQYLHDLSQHK